MTRRPEGAKHPLVELYIPNIGWRATVAVLAGIALCVAAVLWLSR